jgi:GxxExxY protein
MTGTIVTAAMKLHSHLGGLARKRPRGVLGARTPQTGLRVARQVGLPVIYDGQGIDLAYRIDLIVQGTVIVEIKCVESIHPVHQAQLLSYLRRSGRKPGRLINFHLDRLRDGIKRMVDGQEQERRIQVSTLCFSVTSVVKAF